MKIELSKSDAIQKLKNLSATAARYREKAQKTTENVVGLAIAGAAGAGAGYLDAQDYKLPGTDLELHVALGAVAAGLAIFDMGGRYNDQALDAAKGIAGYEAGKLGASYIPRKT